LGNAGRALEIIEAAGCTSASSRSASPRRLDRREHAFRRERYSGQPDADRVLDRICDRGGNPEHAASSIAFAIAVDHPHIGRYRAMKEPVKFTDTPGPAPTAAPTFGQHSDEILTGCGYSAEEIAALRQRRVVL
jgi:hypothetical protein